MSLMIGNSDESWTIQCVLPFFTETLSLQTYQRHFRGLGKVERGTQISPNFTERKCEHAK